MQTKSEIVGVYIGARNFVAAGGLWNSLPPLYRQCAVAYIDFWAAYAGVLPAANDIEQSARNGLSPLTLNDSTTPLDNGCLG